MSERGFIGMATMWITAAVSVLAISTLAMGHWFQTHGAERLVEVQQLGLIQMALSSDVASQFQLSISDRFFETGRVQTARTFNSTKNQVRVEGLIECEKHQKKFEAGFSHVSGTWKIIYWREL